MSNLRLFDYQTAAVEAFKQAGRRGSFIFATGTGKTEIAIGCIEKFLEDYPSGKVIFIVPRIVLIEQTAERLSKYGFPSTPYYGEEKNLTGNIVVSTYQSLCKIEELEGLVNEFISKHGNVLFVFDEVHLASDAASNYIRIMKTAKEFNKDNLSMLALTATIDTKDMEKNGTILTSCPIINTIQMGEAIEKGFLSEVKVLDSGVYLTEENQATYEDVSKKLMFIIDQLGTADPKKIQQLTRSQNYNERQLAFAFLKQIQIKNAVLNFDMNKINKAQELLKSNPGKTLLFAERVKALEMLGQAINDPSVFRYIEAKTPKKIRAMIIEDFKNGRFQCLGTVHTLDIGFDQKDVANCIFLASNRNENQLIQRIGRGVRKAENKEYAQLFVIYAKATQEKEIYHMISRAINDGRTEEPRPFATTGSLIATEAKPVEKKQSVTLTWKNGVLVAQGNTYPIKDQLKQQFFRWVSESKVWSKFCSEQEAQVVAKNLNLVIA